MKISDEAVEAAARALHEAGDWDVPWTGDDWRAEVARNEARKALTASAPFIAAPLEAELRKAQGTIATFMKLADLSAKVGTMEQGRRDANPYRNDKP